MASGNSYIVLMRVTVNEKNEMSRVVRKQEGSFRDDIDLASHSDYNDFEMEISSLLRVTYRTSLH